MRRSSLLLTLALASFAQAELPYNAGVFNEIDFTSVGALQKSSFNAFTAWVSALPLDGSGTNFRMGRSNPIGSVQVTRVTGYDPACIVNPSRSLDVCASRVEETSPYDRVLKIYTQVKKSDGNIVSVPFAQENTIQNIMIRAVGRLFGMPWNTVDAGSVMSDKVRGSNWGPSTYVMFPTVDDANQVRSLYMPWNPYGNTNTLFPIALIETKNSSGTVVSGNYFAGVIGKTYYGSLRQLRWIVSDEVPTGNPGPSILLRSSITNNGRINVGSSASCYSAGQESFGVVGIVGYSTFEYQSAVSGGAYMTEMQIESTSKYDIITSQHPGTANCPRAAGRALDAWSETSW